MLKKLLFFTAIFFLSTTLFAQADLENDIDSALLNAKKGVYWALNNIPLDKTRIENDLIADNKLYSNVKIYMEVNGVKIISTGYYNTNIVTIQVYRSNDNLIKNGYLDKPSE